MIVLRLHLRSERMVLNFAHFAESVLLFGVLTLKLFHLEIAFIFLHLANLWITASIWHRSVVFVSGHAAVITVGEIPFCYRCKNGL